MPSSGADVVKRYFAALDAHDLDAATSCWKLGAVDRFVGQQELLAPAGVRHAPGLIGLVRETDGLALVSDCFYTLDPQTGIKGAARVPHPAFNIDTEQPRASMRKLGDLRPSLAWAGHADPLRGDVGAQLETAATARV